MAKGKTKMSTVQTAPAPKAKILQKTIMTSALEDVLIGRNFTFSPVSSASEAEGRIGGDSAKFLKILNLGLEALEMESARESETGWFDLDDTGKLGEKEVSPKSAGDPTAIKKLINMFATTSTPNWSNLSGEQKAKARAEVKKMLTESPAMMAKLAAAPSSTESEGSEG